MATKIRIKVNHASAATVGGAPKKPKRKKRPR